ncbi:MAG: aldehyde dehydrogenase EutE [Opitutales bacterium]|nr:aldehyde dehydrogenase EutE [Opitutales bacterium]
MDQKLIDNIVAEVMQKLGKPAPAAAPVSSGPSDRLPASPGRRNGSNRRAFGVFETADEACEAAHAAFLQLKEKGLEGRAKVCEIVKKLAVANAEDWGRIELEETRIGRLDHKIEKLKIIPLVPGVEFLHPTGMSGDHGITMEEYTPFGVVGAITPSTHSIPTLSGNIVNIVAAGNAVVFNAHPSGARCAATAVRAYNEAIFRELGIENLVTIIEKPSLDSFQALCAHEATRLLCVTGGPGVVAAAMKTGKRAICAGPGNPPVVVDVSADLDKAAADIIAGASFDNNLLCIGEKQVFVLEQVFDSFMKAMERAGAFRLKPDQIERLAEAAFVFPEGKGAGCAGPTVNRDLVGRDTADLARDAGATIPANTPLLFGETGADHIFVDEEQMMPFLPIVRVKDFDEAARLAYETEHNYKHTAIIHTKNVDQMTQLARLMDTSLFVKNGPSVAGLGLGGEGYLSFSIATPTGEGITNPKTFTRTRRCVMVENLRIY